MRRKSPGTTGKTGGTRFRSINLLAPAADRANVAKLLTRDEALRIAENVVKLPELLRKT